MIEYRTGSIIRKSTRNWRIFGLLIVALVLAVVAFIQVFVQYVNSPDTSSAINLFLILVFIALVLYHVNKSLERVVVTLDHNGLRKFKESPVGSRNTILSIENKDISHFFCTSKRIYVCYIKQPNCFETDSFLFDSCDSGLSEKFCSESKKLVVEFRDPT